MTWYFTKITLVYFCRALVGGVVNVPSIDSSGDIHLFCQKVKHLCMEKGVQIKTESEVKEILTHVDPNTHK